MRELTTEPKRVPLSIGGTLEVRRSTAAHIDECDEVLLRGLVADSINILNGSVEKSMPLWRVLNLAFKTGRYYNDEYGSGWFVPGLELQSTLNDEDVYSVLEAFLDVHGGLMRMAGKSQALARKAVRAATEFQKSIGANTSGAS